MGFTALFYVLIQSVRTKIIQNDFSTASANDVQLFGVGKKNREYL
jgi:hypothetical protein